MHFPISDLFYFRRVIGSDSAGTSDVNSAAVDMREHGGRGVLFLCQIGTIAATGSCTVTIQTSPDNSTWTTWDHGSAAFDADDDHKFCALDLWDPPGRYVRLHIDKSTANVTIAGATALMYGLREMKETDTHNYTAVLTGNG